MRLPSASRSVSLGSKSVSGSKRAALPRDNAAAQDRVELQAHDRVAHPHQRFGREGQARAEAVRARHLRSIRPAACRTVRLRAVGAIAAGIIPSLSEHTLSNTLAHSFASRQKGTIRTIQVSFSLLLQKGKPAVRDRIPGRDCRARIAGPGGLALPARRAVERDPAGTRADQV